MLSSWKHDFNRSDSHRRNISFTDCHYAESCPLDLPDNLSIEELRKSLINVRHLGFFVSMTANALDRFLEMMPNLTSLDVNGLFEADLRILLPCFARAPQKFTKLNLKFEFIEDIVLRDLLSLHTNCLQELHILPRGRLALDKAYDVIADCRKLRRLELGDASCLTDAQLDRIVCKAPDLEVLEYAFARHLTEGGLNQMHRLKKLRRLGMAFATGLPTETLCTVGSLSSLRHLDLTEACCDLTVFRSIASLKELRSLEVGSSEFTSECFSIIVEKFVKLEKLHLHESRMLTDEDGVKFCRLQNLKDLKLAQAWGFTDETFEKGLGSPAMERIDLFDCSLTDVGLASLAAKHASLRELVLAKCRKITDAGVASLLRNLPVLRFFDVLGGPSLGVDAIGLLLGDECPRLTSLFVNELSDGVGDLIRGRRPRLHLWEVYSRS